MRKLCILTIFFMSCGAFAIEPECKGSFINPVTDVDWKAMFPMHIAGAKVVSGRDDKSTKSPKREVICKCSDRVPLIYGIPVGFWQPFRAIDVTRKPYCMVNLGGAKLNVGVKAPRGDIALASSANLGHGYQTAFYHVHWYIYPLLSWLNVLTDLACIQSEGFDIGYMTELDPMWSDDELSSWISPEVLIFANPIAQLACSADCAASSFKYPLDSMFWCAGCQGGVYPLSGTVGFHQSNPDSTTLVAERMIFKLHRQGLLHGTMGALGLCGKYPMLWWKKSQYKLQLVNPVLNNIDMFKTNPIGRTVFPWSAGKDLDPTHGDFGYLLWSRRECCVL